MKAVSKYSNLEIKVSTHRDRCLTFETNDQESTHDLEVSTHVTNIFRQHRRCRHMLLRCQHMKSQNAQGATHNG